MAGHADVEPVMDSGGQIQQFDSHLSGLGKFLNVFPALLRFGFRSYSDLDDRFQYLSVNIS